MRNVEDFVARRFEDILRVSARAQLLLAVLLPIRDRHRLQPIRADQPGRQRRATAQPNRQLLQINRNVPVTEML